MMMPKPVGSTRSTPASIAPVGQIITCSGLMPRVAMLSCPALPVAPRQPLYHWRSERCGAIIHDIVAFEEVHPVGPDEIVNRKVCGPVIEVQRRADSPRTWSFCEARGRTESGAPDQSPAMVRECSGRERPLNGGPQGAVSTSTGIGELANADRSPNARKSASMAEGQAVLAFPLLRYLLLGSPGWAAVRSKRLTWESNAEGGRGVAGFSAAGGIRALLRFLLWTYPSFGPGRRRS